MAFCSSCGTEMSDQAKACPKCGHPSAPAARSVPNYLVQAILTTIFCCLPFGIVSIVFAAQVNSKLAAGDIEGATNASNKAKKWAWVAFGAGLVAIVVSILASTLQTSPGFIP